MLPYSTLLRLRVLSRPALLPRPSHAAMLLEQTRWITQGRKPLWNLKKKNDVPAAGSEEELGESSAREPLSKILGSINSNAMKADEKPQRTTAAAEQGAVPPHPAPQRSTEEPPKAEAAAAPPPPASEKAMSDAPHTPAEAAQPAAASPKPTAEKKAATKALQKIPVPPAKPHTDNIFYRLFASWQQGLVASIGAMMGIGFLFFLFYNPVKEDTVHHTAVVASEALNDLRLRNQTVQLSKDVVDNVLKDPKSLQLVSELVVQLLAKEDTKIAVSSLLQSLFEDHYTQEVTKKFVLTIVRDPWIQDQLHIIFKEQVTHLLQDEDVKKSLTKLLVSSASDGLEDPQLHYRASRAIRGWVATAFNATLASVAVVCASYVAYEIRLGK